MTYVTYADRVRAAKSPQEAMLAIAEGLDAVLSRGPDPADGWGTWGGGSPTTTTSVAVAGEPTSPDAPDFYARQEAPIDHEQAERAMGQIERLQALYAKSPTPQISALLEQATRAYGEIVNPDPRYGILDHSGDIPGEAELGKVTETPDGMVVDLPPASPERKNQRRQLAEAIDLPGFFGPLYNTSPDLRAQIIDSYMKGGPMWLYANRITPDEHDIFTQLSPAAKTAMVSDVAEDSTRAAWEFQRDIMRDEDSMGGTLAIAEDNINGVLDGPRTALKGPE